ncbi:MAG: hypothetical protein RL662_1861 [Bacteroidota bacterium]
MIKKISIIASILFLSNFFISEASTVLEAPHGTTFSVYNSTPYRATVGTVASTTVASGNTIYLSNFVLKCNSNCSNLKSIVPDIALVDVSGSAVAYQTNYTFATSIWNTAIPSLKNTGTAVEIDNLAFVTSGAGIIAGHTYELVVGGSFTWFSTGIEQPIAVKSTGTTQENKLITTTTYIDPTDTRIVEIIPANSALIATSSTHDGIEGATTTVSVEYYINSDDIGFITSLKVDVEQLDQNYLYGFSGFSPYTIRETLAPVAGSGLWTQDIWLPKGNYKVSGSIYTSYLGGTVNNPFGIVENNIVESQDTSNPLAQYHLYTVGGSTTIGGLRQNASNQLETILSSTSTANLADCNILSGFDFGDCMAFSFIPSTAQLNNFGNTLSQTILYKFPIGYVWSVVGILNSTTTTAIPVINATLPSMLPGGGSNIQLALTPGILDPILNATTSIYANVSTATSSATLYTTTSYYWNILVYMAVAMYLLSRILGTHLIGRMGDVFGYEFGSVDYKDKSAHGKKRYNVKGQSYREYTDSDIKKMIKKGGELGSSVDSMRGGKSNPRS